MIELNPGVNLSLVKGLLPVFEERIVKTVDQIHNKEDVEQDNILLTKRF